MYCPHCGQENRENARFCGQCGQQMTVVSPAEINLADVEQARVSGRIIRRFWWLVPLFGLGLLIVWATLVRESPASSEVVALLPTSTVTATFATATGTPEPATRIPASIATRTPLPTVTASVVASPSPFPTNTSTPQATVTATSSPMPTLEPSITPTRDLGPETLLLGRSAVGSPIEAVRFGNGPNVLVLVGGVHAGYSPGTVVLASELIDHFSQNPALIPASVTLFIVRSLNPDSPLTPGRLPGRLNSAGVDLNRNWDCRWTANPEIFGDVVRGAGGIEPYDQPETQALAALIEREAPAAVVVWGARAVNGLASHGSCIDRHLPSEELAATYGRAAGYRIDNYEEVAQSAVSGDLTNWLAARAIPAAAILLPSYEQPDFAANLAGVLSIMMDIAEGR